MARMTKSLGLRMDPAVIKQLDKLCTVNNRSRPLLLEMLISNAFKELKKDKDRRITV